jgi:hypothetical protein
MNPEPFTDPAALHRYAKAHGLEYAWAYSPAFNKRLRTLSPEQYELREVRTRKGVTNVLSLYNGGEVTSWRFR